ncbi:Acyltransferase family protein [Arsukibacterium tuosuense]|uniref:Acyltransferase family protein n=1 Tax=Arsukibacterium tuosuense TaxID=1323745 RepID=A0A285IMA8_9GAMM|nr:acyltransferase [Arsukibacterium tuosuense]SNY49108.1 Acyltransferase family protein [Arsukibacterium tuosuense]
MLTTSATTQVIPRRYELDWLRVLAFGLLIFYHTGMLYVERWGFHFKSQYLSSSLEYLMLLSSPWRMLLIWFISGYALGAVILHCAGWRQYFKFGLRRTVILLLPLLVGLWLIVPPQLYAEMVQKDGLSLSYWQFYQAFFDLQHPLFADYQSGVWPHVDVNHLWFLRSLWQFTLLVLLLMPILNSRRVQQACRWLFQLALPWQVFAWSLLLLAIRFAASGDAVRELQGLVVFLLGILVVRQPDFWQQLAQPRRWLGWLCLLNYGALCGLYFLAYQPDQLPALLQPAILPGLHLSFSVQAVAMLCWILVLAQRYLSKPHRKLALANRMVFPVYLLHQSLIIIAALWLTPFALGGFTEAALVLMVTLSGSALCLLVCWHLPLLAPLVGLRTPYQFSTGWRKAGLFCGALLVTPLVVNLLL